MGPFLLESFEMKRPRKALSSIFIANEILLFFMMVLPTLLVDYLSLSKSKINASHSPK